MIKEGTWHPLLDGELARQAWQAIRDVAVAVEATAEPPQRTRDATLGGGSAGLALLFSYLAEVCSDDHYADVAVACLEHSVQAIADFPMLPALYEGFIGLGWTVAHLEGRLIESDEEESAHQVIDQALLELLQHPARILEYDLISGLVGYGVYALEGLERPLARSCLELLVTRLEERAEERESGVTWFTPPESLPGHQRELAPKGYYNLGVAHGVPAVAALLGQVCDAGLAAEQARSLLDRTVEWILSEELEGEAGACFPSWVGESVEPQPSRLAWCYGDLGVAAALLLAARCVGHADWEQEAVRVAHRAAERRLDDSRVQDVGLCHGAAGIAHLFNRLYQATGEERLAQAARFWFRQTLEMRRPGEGVAGFLAWGPDDDMALGWRADRGFLTGAAGVALALLGAVSPVEPEWDRMLLTSIPPGRG